MLLYHIHGSPLTWGEKGSILTRESLWPVSNRQARHESSRGNYEKGVTTLDKGKVEFDLMKKMSSESS